MNAKQYARQLVRELNSTDNPTAYAQRVDAEREWPQDAPITRFFGEDDDD